MSRSGDAGKYFTARFTPPKPIAKEMEAEIAGIVAGLMDADIKRTFEAEEAAMDSEGGSCPDGPPEDEPGYAEKLEADARAWIDENQ